MFSESFVKFFSVTIRSLYNFLYFWYVKSSKDFWSSEIRFMHSVEREIGVIINLRLITQPIFGDYSYTGRFLGPFFRFCRVVIGLVVLLISFFSIITLYVIWVFLPPVVFYMIFLNLIYLIS